MFNSKQKPKNFQNNLLRRGGQMYNFEHKRLDNYGSHARVYVYIIKDKKRSEALLNVCCPAPMLCDFDSCYSRHMSIDDFILPLSS